MKKLMNSTPLTDNDLQQFFGNQAVRKEAVTQNFYLFFHFYFSHYIKYPTAPFQREMMELAGDSAIENLFIEAFRSSGKSTLMTTVLPLWGVISRLNKKYIVIVSQTQNQAQQHLSNIAHELATNELIRKDFWPYDVEENELGVAAINLPKFGARIIAVSREQGIRGLRLAQHRPDLVVADDCEDSKTVKNQESRNANYAWLTGELLTLGSEDSKYIIVGNLLHEDSLLMRLKKGVKDGTRDGVYRSYPIERGGKALWPGRFPDKAAIRKLERRIADPIRFEREYRLHLVPDEEQIITHDMIHTYSELSPPLRNEQRFLAIGVDPAISQKDAADCMAMITLDIRGEGDSLKFYVLPNPINGHPGFPETMDLIKELNTVHRGPTFYVESNAYQMAIVQAALREAIDVRAINLQMDKRTRLNMISSHIRDGTILFPESGCELVITQLTGFGVERYDDLVDALTILIIGYLREQQDENKSSVEVVGRMVSPRGTVGSPRVFVPTNKSFSSRSPSREYWNRRLDDWDEATSDKWD